MATFLQLVRDAAWESGTVPDALAIGTLGGLTGRSRRFAGWVRDAWLDIQRRRTDWRWMRRSFTGALVPGLVEHDAAALGAARFARWRLRDDFGRSLATLDADAPRQATTVAVVGLERLHEAVRLRPETGRPRMVAVTHQDRLLFHPAPDRAYALTGWYDRAPQTLAQDGDVPEMPERFHDLIRWQALVLMGTFDEAVPQLGEWQARVRAMMFELERDQLPPVEVAGLPLGEAVVRTWPSAFP